MVPQAILAPWARLFASLALEVILVVALTALLARLIRPASGQRTVWRVSFVVIAALVLAEFSGLGHSLLQNLRVSTPATPPPHTLVTIVVTTDTLAAPAWAPPAANVPMVPAVNPHEKRWSTVALWLPGVALAGLIWLLVRRSLGALKLMRLGRQGMADGGDLAARVQALGRRLGIRRHVRVKSIAGLSSPIAFGLFRPTVGVPKDFSARFTTAQQEAMLAHELAHVAAFDAVWLLLADLVTALLWWHPGAWWARRHLRAASETAADEASLLLDDGPATLAECLVTLGEILTRSPDPGGLGMAGFRFRSELGRRVERLLRLRGSSRQPWRGATAWLARFLVPAALLGLAFGVTAWLLPPAVGAATVGESFQRSPLGLATTSLLTADKDTTPRLIYRGKDLHDVEKAADDRATKAADDRANDVPTLLLQGQQLYEAGKTDEAAAKWRTAIELDPGNKVALDYLARIGRTNSPAAKSTVQPTDAPTPSTGTNLAYTSNGRRKTYEKLGTIRLDTVKFDNVPLGQALEQVTKEAKKRDPAKKGINIIISTPNDPQAGPTRAVKPEDDITAATVKIDPELNDVTLGQVLDILVKVADRPIKYSVEEYGVLFSLRGAESPVLHTRWYKIDLRTFLQGMKAVSASDFGTWNKVPVLGDLPFMGRFFRSAEVSSERGLTVQTTMETVRTYFQTAGVNLDSPKSIIFNDRLGMLMVRATLADHDVIEQVIQRLNVVAPDASPRHDRVEEAAQARTAGIPAPNTDVSEARAETAKPPFSAPKPLPSAPVDLPAAPPPELHTRWFKIDPNTFMQGLKGVMAQDSGRSKTLVQPAGQVVPVFQGGTDFLTAPTPLEIVSTTVRTYFQTAGVILDPPKSIIFNDRLGMLMVRATLADLDLIEQAVQVLNTAPPQVQIEVKFCEVPEELLAAPGLKLQPNITATNGAGTNVASKALTSILTPDQSRNVLRALEQRKDVTFLAAPSVITPSGRQAQLKTVKVQSIVTGLDLSTNAPAEPGKLPEHPPITETFEFGLVVDIIPSVAADRRTIIMRVIAGLKEFAGYDFSGGNDLWDYVESEGANPAPPRPPQKPPRPIFRERQAMSSATLWDGQTFVLASRDVLLKSGRKINLSELPETLVKDLLRRGFGAPGSSKQAILIFLTPTIVDPAGNAIHTDTDIPDRTNSVPSILPPPLK